LVAFSVEKPVAGIEARAIPVKRECFNSLFIGQLIKVGSPKSNLQKNMLVW
jgi:hypothetical protein